MTQQAGDRTTPDFLHGMLLKEDIAPDSMFYIQSTASDGEMNVQMPVELTAVGVQGTEDTDLNTLFASPAEHGADGSSEEGIEQRPVVIEEGPQQMGHGESDVLPVAVGKDMRLFATVQKKHLI